MCVLKTLKCKGVDKYVLVNLMYRCLKETL
nr:MAG TPA: hypothetical protein [Caudoviricetes sp.]